MDERFGMLNLWALKRKGTENIYLKLDAPFREEKGTVNVFGTETAEATWEGFELLTKGFEEEFQKENYECVPVTLFILVKDGEDK